MDCQEHNFCLVHLPNSRGGRDTIHSGHIDVEKDDIRLQFDDLSNGLFAVFSLTAYVERVQIEQRPDRGSSRVVIINDEYSGCQFVLPDCCRQPLGGAGTSECGFLLSRQWFCRFNTGEAVVSFQGLDDGLCRFQERASMMAKEIETAGDSLTPTGSSSARLSLRLEFLSLTFGLWAI